MSNTVNAPAANVSYFTPAQYPVAGSAVDPQPSGAAIPTLFEPLKIRGVEFQNRIFLSPLCQYSAENGAITAWHLAHLGGIFTRGPGLTFVEAAAVVPEGRITPEDVGIWSDDCIKPFAELVEFAHSQNQKIAIQLAHAGRKASTVAPWLSSDNTADEVHGGWPDNVFGPSDIPYSDTYPKPKALTKEGIRNVVNAFAKAAGRAVRAGFDVIEIHNAHGYLLHSFVSPVSNNRTDAYGGSFENRTRLTLEIVDAVRAVIPPTMPLFLRISGSDCLEESMPVRASWTSSETVKLAKVLATRGVDLLDVSSGGLHPSQKFNINASQPYQVHFSEAVKKALPANSPMLVGAVGSIKDGRTAQSILDAGQADVIFVGRQFQKNPGTVWAFAEDLGVDINIPHQISLGFKGRDPRRSLVTKESKM
ncbi:FMN-linked oxidoreductase [Pleurotus eryngii]|uniref:FMN-linked oxidoreductase n=1 Tax=Pleurotus eryngii TaxID=5323 RepID=A0A9P6D7X2_PLEER|nr:FMN-linked oxidoreductase [Pleurotus eryngii]